MISALQRLSDEGVAVWLDDISRSRLESGDLAALVRDRHVVGVTTNPTIFCNALAESDAYRGQLDELAQLPISAGDATRIITCADVRAACDVLRPVYDATDGVDGWVSIEVDPSLARDPAGTRSEARLLRWLVDRPNVMIKIPATVEALPAIADCLAEGISVNVTLLFSVDRYRSVLGAHLRGLERALNAGHDISRIASVASFFISRVDTEVDRRLFGIDSPRTAELAGRAAIANARLAYQHLTRELERPRWRGLAIAGARPQRLLWASTGVKDRRYEDTRYVTELVAPFTVNTMPAATLAAVADHGVIRGDSITGGYAEAAAVIDNLAAAGISLPEITYQLEVDGLRQFQHSWTALVSEVQRALAHPRTPARTA